jgi:hypothetical protein
MDDALRKLAQSVQVIRSLHRNAGSDVEGYATKGAVTDPLEIAKSEGGDVIDTHAVAAGDLMPHGSSAKAHPASIIPGVHIVGHNPIFHGDE